MTRLRYRVALCYGWPMERVKAMTRRELNEADTAIRRRDGERLSMAMDAASFPWADEDCRRRMLEDARRMAAGTPPGVIDRTDRGDSWGRLKVIMRGMP